MSPADVYVRPSGVAALHDRTIHSSQRFNDLFERIDRYAFSTEFYKNFYNTDLYLGKRVSKEVMQASWNIAAGASATASLACVPTWHEDFRQDLAHVDVPTLVIHGDDDRIVPIAAAGQRTAKLIEGARLHVVKGDPHCVTWTHAEEVNEELLGFLWRESCQNQARSGVTSLNLETKVCRAVLEPRQAIE